MVKVEHSVEINKPVNQVWIYLTDFENTPKWDIGVHETKQTSKGPAGLGTTFQNIGTFLGRNSIREYQVIEYEPNKKVTVKLITPDNLIQKAEVSYSFDSTTSGTKLTFIGSVGFGGFFKLIQPFLTQRAQKDGQGDLDNLKRLLEAHPDSV